MHAFCASFSLLVAHGNALLADAPWMGFPWMRSCGVHSRELVMWAVHSSQHVVVMW